MKSVNFMVNFDLVLQVFIRWAWEAVKSEAAS